MYTLEAKYPEGPNNKKMDRLLIGLVGRYNGHITGDGFSFGWREMDLEFRTRRNRADFITFVSENHPEVLLTDN